MTETKIDIRLGSEPKLFMSYSWTTQDHEAWVMQLAERLSENGVHVVLDKWDLKEGHDANVFMERMVADTSINKVVLVSDPSYAEKADARSGGVGTEAQIISSEVYAKQEQDKFVAVIPERNESGEACLPTYYKGRIYIDLSDSSRYQEEYEKLVRWIYDKPLHIRPTIGKPPAFITGPTVSLGTTALFQRCVDALKNSRPHAKASASEYYATFAENLERFAVETAAGEHYDDAFIRNIEEFLPYRNEALRLIGTIALYSPTEQLAHETQRFFERLLNGGKIDLADNFLFLVHELFLHTIALLVEREAFQFANILLQTQYYTPERASRGGPSTRSFTAFRNNVECLQTRNRRLNLRRLSLHADLLRERTDGEQRFQGLLQADFLLFLRSRHEQEYWYPETLLYADRAYSAFEVFARSSSRNYFDKLSTVLGMDHAELNTLLETFSERGSIPRWEHSSFNPHLLVGHEKLATLP